MQLLRFVLVFTVMAAPPSWAQSGSNSDSVLTVQGSAEVRVVPDLAVVRLGIVEQAPTAENAQDAVNRVANRIINALPAAGIDESDVQTSRLTLSPVYSRQRPDGSQPPSIIAYRAANTITVRVEVSLSSGTSLKLSPCQGRWLLTVSTIFWVTSFLPCRRLIIPLLFL